MLHCTRTTNRDQQTVELQMTPQRLCCSSTTGEALTAFVYDWLELRDVYSFTEEIQLIQWPFNTLLVWINVARTLSLVWHKHANESNAAFHSSYMNILHCAGPPRPAGNSVKQQVTHSTRPIFICTIGWNSLHFESCNPYTTIRVIIKWSVLQCTVIWMDLGQTSINLFAFFGHFLV